MRKSGPDTPERHDAAVARRPGPAGLLYLPLAIGFGGGVVWLALAGPGRGPAYLLVPVAGLALLAVLLMHHYRFRQWFWIAGGFMFLVLLLAFLVTDEAPTHRPPSLEKLSPSFPGAQLSHDTLLRFVGVDGKLLGIDNRQVMRALNATTSVDPREAAKFSNLLLTERAAIEADWNAMKPVRDWWMELAAFDRLGDLSPGRPEDPLIPFQVVRAYLQTAVAVAGLAALDGNGDAAFTLLEAVAAVTRMLEPSSRTLVRAMIARVGQNQVIGAANFILDHATVSPEAKASFAKALAEGSSGADGVRHMIAVETARTSYVLEDPIGRAPWNFGQPGSLQNSMAAAVAPMFYNPQRTVNAFLAWSTQQEDLAARREFSKLDALTEKWLKDTSSLGMQNFGGRYLLREATPAYAKVVEDYWKSEDAREALLKRLKAPDPSAQPSTPGRPLP